MSTEYFLFGAGGHGKVVYETWVSQCEDQIQIWDDDVRKDKMKFLNSDVHALINWKSLPEIGHIAIGNNIARQQISNRITNSEGKYLISIIHPDALLSKFTLVGIGSFIAAGATVGPDSTLGQGVIVNHGAVVDHDCHVGEFSHIAPNATLGGEVNVGKGCLIGSGSVLLPGVNIADGVAVGAGAVVTEDIAQENIVVCGVPASQTGSVLS